MRASLYLALTACIAACSHPDDGSPATSAPRVVDSSGVRIVTHDLEPRERSGTQVWELDVAPSVQIDSIARPANPDLHLLTGLTFLDSGELIVGHGSLRELLVFDERGDFVRSIGRMGAGPGEFRSLTGPWTTAEGHIVAYDPALRRVTVFDVDGRLVRTVSVPATALSDSARLIWQSFGVTSDGVTLLWVDGEPKREGGIERPDMWVVALDTSGTAWPVGGARPGLERYVMPQRRDGSLALGISPFAASPLVTACGDRIVVADNQAYALTVTDTDGTVAMALRATVDQRHASDADFGAALRAQFGPDTDTSEEAIAPARMMTPGGLLPVLRSVHCDAERNIWVEEHPHDSGRWSRVISFTPAGERRSTFMLPEGMRMLAVKPAAVAVAVKDTLGRERVAVYSLVDR